MEWRGRRESENVEDRRGIGGITFIGGGAGLVIILIISLLTGQNPLRLLQQVGGGGTQVAVDGNSPATGSSSSDDPLSHFVRVVLADTEDVWNARFAAMGKDYPEPKLVLFTMQVNSACGGASAASGPFYCPEDGKVYIDLSFYNELHRRFGAPGDFAQAYVIAHEVGHHVQRLLGISEKVERLRGRVTQEEYNRWSVRLELQADFLAGVWAHDTERAKQVLEAGDLEEALRAAAAIGDDTLQRRSRGYVVPESFTHGTAAQRVHWFRKGWETSDLNQGDTFSLSDSEL